MTARPPGAAAVSATTTGVAGNAKQAKASPTSSKPTVALIAFCIRLPMRTPIQCKAMNEAITMTARIRPRPISCGNSEPRKSPAATAAVASVRQLRIQSFQPIRKPKPEPKMRRA